MDKKKKTIIAVSGAAVLVLVLLIMGRKDTAPDAPAIEEVAALVSAEPKAEVVTNAPAASDELSAYEIKLAKRESWIRELMALYDQPREFFDEDTLFMIYAFQFGDEELVNARMLELLQRDTQAALETMSKLDGSFMTFDTELPYETVKDYLMANYSPDESMNMMGEMLFTSQSIREVGSMLFMDWAQQDPAGQLQWITDNPTFDSEYIFIDYFKQEMQGENAAAIMEAMMNLPADDPRADFLIKESIQLMAVNQPAEAAEILNSVDFEDPRYFDAVGLVASGTAREDGELGMEWAGSIPHPEIRMGAQLSAGSSFLANDPDGFYEWFDNTDFEDSPIPREDILEHMEQAAEMERNYYAADPVDPLEGTDRRGLPIDPEKRGPVPDVADLHQGDGDVEL